jgi:hypothetical protein
MIKICSLVLIFVFFIISLNTFSQTKPVSNTQEKDISSLSLEYQKSKTQGMSDQEFSVLAKKQGYKDSEIQSAINSGNRSLKNNPENIVFDGEINNSSNDLRKLVQLEEDELFMSGNSSSSINEFERKIFGYEVFNNKRVNFSPNLNMPTPSDYIVGPGDQLIIQVYGIAQGDFTLQVSPDGKIVIPDVGIIHVSSLTI